jgi:ABC-2 type transport system ATP-binding protein
MIHVKQLSKIYGDVRAISEIDFSVSAGEVVGLLGPNGAGKTTTMRVLCGCIGATSGSVHIGGVNVREEPIVAKARVGYLPEQPPLYDEMTVLDFVIFSATLQGVSDPKSAAQRTLKAVGLDAELGGRPVSERIIGRLSKGYRQRVGLAAALVHDPDVLVLDEPTSGLDPAQRKDLRRLLANLANREQRTVILSTHILAEVEALCDRVIIINQGKVIATDTIEHLRSLAGTLHLSIQGEAEPLIARLLDIDGVVNAHAVSDGLIAVSTSQDCRAEIAHAAADHGLLELTHSEGLEDVYLRLIEGAQ